MNTTELVQDPRFILASLRYHCKLNSIGLKTGVPKTMLRQRVEKVTVRTFKRGDWAGMIVALQELLDASN